MLKQKNNLEEKENLLNENKNFVIENDNSKRKKDSEVLPQESEGFKSGKQIILKQYKMNAFEKQN